MKRLFSRLNFVLPTLVVGALVYFIFYSVNIYKPTGYVACGSTMVAKQTDVAIHTIRQWFGKEGNHYPPCPETPTQ